MHTQLDCCGLVQSGLVQFSGFQEMRQLVAVVVAPFSGKKLDLTGPLNTNHLRENWLLLFVGICNTSSSFRTIFIPNSYSSSLTAHWPLCWYGILQCQLQWCLRFIHIWRKPFDHDEVRKQYSHRGHRATVGRHTHNVRCIQESKTLIIQWKRELQYQSITSMVCIYT